ncbi:MAG: 16S rRNA (uracil(1498)-N(3))-methyltransferase [Bacteroidota bacterium]
MQLFYSPNIHKDTDTFSFSSEESRHILKVLRKKEGDLLQITNGKGFLFEAEIIVANPRACQVAIGRTSQSTPKAYTTHLAVAPTKLNDRYAFFLEKATEIGLDEITPVICERSERKTLKLERMERILQAAMKQSLQTFLPKLNAPVPFTDFVERERTTLKFIAHCANDEKKQLIQDIPPKKDIVVLIGPEGDFSPSEIHKAGSKGYLPLSLGTNRLRTETAALMACSAIALINME